jgi:hypothetical protein
VDVGGKGEWAPSGDSATVGVRVEPQFRFGLYSAMSG